MRKLFWTILVTKLAGLSGCAVASPGDVMVTGAPGAEVALGIARIARSASVGDPAVIERELRLHGLAAVLTWEEPSQERGRGVLHATWTPTGSPITRIELESRPFNATGKTQALKVLRVRIAPAQCPNDQVLRSALGVKPYTGAAPSAIGGETAHFTSYNMTNDPARDVRVVVYPDDACSITVTLVQAR